MKALLLSENRKLELVEMPQPKCSAHDLLIRVKACGICGSDVHGYDGSSGRRIPPLVMGHEASGIVEQIGEAVNCFKVGDRVTFDSTIYCGVCAFCRAGKVNLCDNRRVMGVSCADYRQHGAFAEFVVVPAHIAYHLPATLSFEHAAMVEAVSVAVHAVGRTPIALGDSVVVVGAGMIGQLVVQTLRARGCGTLIAVDLDEGRLALAQRYGADYVINGSSDDVASQVQALTGGQGVAVAIEVVGATASIQTAVSSVRKGGSVTLIGNLAPHVEVPLQAIVTRELTLIGSCASSGEYPACMELMARGAINVSDMISAVAPLEEGAEWFDRLYNGEAGLMKVLLRP
jgi:L-iditol 2-dehydrogenase